MVGDHPQGRTPDVEPLFGGNVGYQPSQAVKRDGSQQRRYRGPGQSQYGPSPTEGGDQGKAHHGAEPCSAGKGEEERRSNERDRRQIGPARPVPIYPPPDSSRKRRRG